MNGLFDPRLIVLIQNLHIQANSHSSPNTIVERYIIREVVARPDVYVLTGCTNIVAVCLIVFRVIIDEGYELCMGK